MMDVLNELAFYFSQLDWISLLDILLVALVIYAVLALLRGTQAMALLRGILLLVMIIALLAMSSRLRAFSWLLRNALPSLLIAIPVIFAPEIRRALERLGRTGLLWQLGAREADVCLVIDNLVQAAQRLAERRHGGLIVIERSVGLRDYADTGISLDAAVSAELLLQIFYPNTPLHDGAVIIKNNRLCAAACILPLASGEPITDRQMGLRHRAALGISEISDAVAIVISEESGIISVAYNSRMIRRLDALRLKHILTAFYRPRRGRSLGAWFRRRHTAAEVRHTDTARDGKPSRQSGPASGRIERER